MVGVQKRGVILHLPPLSEVELSNLVIKARIALPGLRMKVRFRGRLACLHYDTPVVHSFKEYQAFQNGIALKQNLKFINQLASTVVEIRIHRE